MVDKFSGFAIVGVPFVAIKYNAFSGFWFRYGGSPSIISGRPETLRMENVTKVQVDHQLGRKGDISNCLPIAMIPKDQMSTLCPYSFLVTTSGAIQ